MQYTWYRKIKILKVFKNIFKNYICEEFVELKFILSDKPDYQKRITIDFHKALETLIRFVGIDLIKSNLCTRFLVTYIWKRQQYESKEETFILVLYPQRLNQVLAIKCGHICLHVFLFHYDQICNKMCIYLLQLFNNHTFYLAGVMFIAKARHLSVCL